MKIASLCYNKKIGIFNFDFYEVSTIYQLFRLTANFRSLFCGWRIFVKKVCLATKIYLYLLGASGGWYWNPGLAASDSS